MENNKLMAEYGYISVISDINRPKQAKRQRIEIHSKYYYRGYAFLVHRSIQDSGWVVSEERSGAISSGNRKRTKQRIAKRDDCHGTPKEAMAQSKLNIDNYMNEGGDLEDVIASFVIMVLTRKSTYLDLLKKRII